MKFFPGKALGIGLIIVFAGVCSGVAVEANNWNYASSGHWENFYWSLGVLPSTNQDVLLTNAGSKVVEITRNTALNFPDSLKVRSATIESVGAETNLLRFNLTGLDKPFAAQYVYLGRNSALELRGSALDIMYGFNISGRIKQELNSRVSCGYADLSGGSVYEFNGGIIEAGTESIVGYGPARFVQTGGFNQATIIRISHSGTYELLNGTLKGMVWPLDGGSFIQRGGTVRGSAITPVDGNFLQTGGSLVAQNGTMYIPGFYMLYSSGMTGTACQTGGTNEHLALTVGLPTPAESGEESGGCYNMMKGDGSYTLSNGVLITSSTSILPNGILEQWGGKHEVRGLLSVRGTITYIVGRRGGANHVSCERPGIFWLHGGKLAAQDLSIGGVGRFIHSQGTNEIAGTIQLGGLVNPLGYWSSGLYTLAGGFLKASNIIVSGFNGLTQVGGQVLTTNLALVSTTFRQAGGTIRISSVLTFSGSEWSLATGTQMAGRLQLTGMQATSHLSLGRSPSVVRFSDSSQMVWQSDAKLVISGWEGSLIGGGQHQILFGATANGLATQQLSQIEFQNPAGLIAGVYPARILATGEVLPTTGEIRPLVTLVDFHSGRLKQVHLKAALGHSYLIEVSSNLLDWVPWTTRSNNNGMIWVTDTDAGKYQQRFYRARLVR
jgi:hypothetical protein